MHICHYFFDIIVVVFLLSLSVKEACIILCLNVGSALLMKDLLKAEESETRAAAAAKAVAKDPLAKSALHELGIYCLSSDDVLILLNLRASLSS